MFKKLRRSEWSRSQASKREKSEDCRLANLRSASEKLGLVFDPALAYLSVASKAPSKLKAVLNRGPTYSREMAVALSGAFPRKVCRELD